MLGSSNRLKSKVGSYSPKSWTFLSISSPDNWVSSSTFFTSNVIPSVSDLGSAAGVGGAGGEGGGGVCVGSGSGGTGEVSCWMSSNSSSKTASESSSASNIPSTSAAVVSTTSSASVSGCAVFQTSASPSSETNQFLRLANEIEGREMLPNAGCR